MIITTARNPVQMSGPYLIYCPRCKDRVRFEACSANETFCTCTVPLHKRAHNCLRIAGIRARKSDHVCDARCVNATGPNCECSCNGANHGGKYSASR